ncbi:hypothetical protein HMPREF0072_0302 [Anaerococcus lactolyticus ATCC 51172]|uniref:Uncharacterized protein n=1 Tax=Anaerococcus lactolyticus ATCC 51172 TaxID=525254 RepID=C2BD82_9FIRM|nr:hypothetical protein [Anaerococcus lactolyticus]EEI87069.1 hypothetical protein HMPREF0072_0302 [Anaerococcus lactolyticus ATCC 51172]
MIDYNESLKLEKINESDLIGKYNHLSWVTPGSLVDILRQLKPSFRNEGKANDLRYLVYDLGDGYALIEGSVGDYRKQIPPLPLDIQSILDKSLEQEINKVFKNKNSDPKINELRIKFHANLLVSELKKVMSKEFKSKEEFKDSKEYFDYLDTEYSKIDRDINENISVKKLTVQDIEDYFIDEYGNTREESYKSILNDYLDSKEIGVAYYESDNGVSIQSKFSLDTRELIQYINGVEIEREFAGDVFLSYTPSYDDLVRVDVSDKALKEIGLTYDSYNELTFIDENKVLLNSIIEEFENQVMLEADGKPNGGKSFNDETYKDFYEELELHFDIDKMTIQEFNKELSKCGLKLPQNIYEKYIENKEDVEMTKDVKDLAIKFSNKDVHEYKTKDVFDNNKEIVKFRIKFPEESDYKNFSLDTKIAPRVNDDGLTSYMYISPEFEYRAIAPGLSKDGAIDWENKKEIKISGSDLQREFNKGKERLEKLSDEIKKNDVFIKFLNTSVNEYKVNDLYYDQGEHSKFRIRFPEESQYKDFSIDTKIKPIKNKDNQTSYIYIDKDYDYKIIAPGIDENKKLNWEDKSVIKVKGSELKFEFDKGLDRLNEISSQKVSDEKIENNVKEIGKDNRKR